MRYSKLFNITLFITLALLEVGWLDATEDLFHGTEILTKCPSKYEAEADRKERPASRTN